MRVLITDKLAREGVDILKAVPEFTVDCPPKMSAQDLKKAVKDYDALIVRSGTTLTSDIIAAADRLKFIGRAGVGLDNVDLEAATRKGIVVMNTPAGNTTATAEQTMSLILALSRNIPQAAASMKKGRWDRAKFKGVELHGKTLGIVGLGRIGSTVASMAKGFGMRIIGHDPYLSADVAQKWGIRLMTLAELLREADYLTLHIPKTPETTDLITAKELVTMKRSAFVINCARGGIINEEDLARALNEGVIKGAAVDVYSQEPPDMAMPLFKCETCVATPHLGASTSEAQINVAVEIAETIRDALLGKSIMNAANFPSVSSEAYDILAPYIDLSEKMGLFAGQLTSGAFKRVRIFYSGEMTAYNLAPLSMSLVYGLLSPHLEESVNRVNVMGIARERGIEIEAVKSEREEEFVNLVRVEIQTDGDMLTVWGTLSGNKQPRIVKVNKVYVEAVPEGWMLVIHNHDKPGVVGTVGTLLAENHINIGGITFGREAPGRLAVSVVNVDHEVDDRTVDAIRQNRDVIAVKQLKL